MPSLDIALPPTSPSTFAALWANVRDTFCPPTQPPVEVDRVQSYTEVQALTLDWDAFVAQFAPHNLYLSRDYLTALEAAVQGTATRCVYVLFYRRDVAVGAVLCQVNRYDAVESGRLDRPNPDLSFWARLNARIKRTFARWGNSYIFVAGNLYATNERHYVFHPTLLNREAQANLLYEGIEQARRQTARQMGVSIPVTLHKEFFEGSLPLLAEVERHGALRVAVEPNMTLRIDPTWQTFEDYLDAMHSKYRVRARRALTKLEGLETRCLTAKEIAENEATIYALYRNVEREAGYNMAPLPLHYFTHLAETLPNGFKMQAYYNEAGEMVGFCTLLRTLNVAGGEAEAHYIGLNHAYNASHLLYLNMLYALVRQGIEWRVERLVFARTAPEIKSSVGAVAEEMYLFIRHHNPVLQEVLKYAFRALQPEREEWVARHPFR